MQHAIAALSKDDIIFAIFTENWNEDGGLGQRRVNYL
jgi:hypothetical protein